jgi:hypothetical protein
MELNFKKFDFPIPSYVNTYTFEKQREIYDYLKSMDEKKQKAYLIAYHHLGTSFDIYRSNGFQEWKKTHVVSY